MLYVFINFNFSNRKAVISGMTAGALGQFLANPTDVVKIQLQMEGKRLREGKPPRLVWIIDAQ